MTELDLSPYRADNGKPVRYKAAKALGRVQLTAFRKTGNDRRRYDEARVVLKGPVRAVRWAPTVRRSFA